MGKSQRDKGGRVERGIVALFKDAGFEAERVPLSGGAGGSYDGDVIITTPLGKRKAEIKARANGEGFKTIERWLGANDLLILKRDRQPPMIIIPFAEYARLLDALKTAYDPYGRTEVDED